MEVRITLIQRDLYKSNFKLNKLLERFIELVPAGILPQYASGRIKSVNGSKMWFQTKCVYLYMAVVDTRHSNSACDFAAGASEFPFSFITRELGHQLFFLLLP